MRLRSELRHQRRRADGRSVLGFGLRLGYWPCLHAPFVRVDFGPWIVEVWYGMASYFCATSLTKETT